MICPNPYCPNSTGGTCSPTAEEIGRLRNELKRGIGQLETTMAKRLLEKLDKKEITLQICKSCGAWLYETYDSREEKVTQLMASPFKYNVGDQVKVTL